MAKKPSPKKLDLTNLAALNTRVISEPDEPASIAPDTSAQVSNEATADEEQAPVSEAAAAVDRRQFDRIPKRSEFKPVPVLESASNTDSEIFNQGDTILVKAPWGVRATVQITAFYQDDSGNAWAQYSASECPPGWSWLGGCVRAALLVKA